MGGDEEAANYLNSKRMLQPARGNVEDDFLTISRLRNMLHFLTFVCNLGDRGKWQNKSKIDLISIEPSSHEICDFHAYCYLRFITFGILIQKFSIIEDGKIELELCQIAND